MDEDNEMSPEMARKKWSNGYLYILDYGDGKQFKVGITSGDPTKRLNQITRNAGHLLPNPLDAELVVSLEMNTNPYYLEQLIHMQLADQHVGGEWFKFESSDWIVDIVDQIKPFGNLEYYDRWYSYFNDDYLAYIVAGVYPGSLSYNKHLYNYCATGQVKVRLVDDDTEALARVARYRAIQ